MPHESIEALLNPSLKVSRPVAACARCRSAKIKCDGRLPACSACERAGKTGDCSSANDDFARGKERSYVAALETAVQRLRKKIDDARQDDSTLTHGTLIMQAHDRPSLQHRHVSNSQRKEAGSVDELVSGFGFLTVNATSRDFQGFSDTMSFAKMLKAVALKQTLPRYERRPLPPRNSISYLVNHYLDNVHVLLPFLSETEFMGSLGRVYQEPPKIDVVSSFDVWCYHLVLAISSASLCRVKGDQHYDSALYNISVGFGVVEQVIHPGSISGIQALLLLVQYSLVDPEYLDGWYLIGMAARLVVDLGLHCEPAPESKTSKHMLDLRRRVFYCTYALDRQVSMALGLAFSFTDDSAPNVLLPTLATDQESRSPSQLFLRSIRPSLFLFDIRRVQSAYYQRTRWSSRQEWTTEASSSYITSTVDDIQAWHASLPQSFSDRALQYFHLEFLYSDILALTPNQVIPMTSITNSHKIMFFQRAIQFSEQLRNMVQSSEFQVCLSYVDCCRARYVSRQFKNVMWANFDLIIRGDQGAGSPIEHSSALENCNQALLFLSNISQILAWPKERWGISVLREVFEQESAVLLARLQTRQQEYSANSASSNASAFQHQQPMPKFANNNTAQQVNVPYPSRPGFIPNQHYRPDLLTYPGLSMNDSALFSNPAMHYANLLQGSSWAPNSEDVNPELPSGTLPRRSYRFG